jgi:hypothetical protein
MRYFLSLLMGVLLCLFAFAPAEANNDGLVAYWSFDEIVNGEVADLSGNSNDGTVSGAIPASGISGSALSFDGLDDYVRVLDDESLRITTFTIEWWMNREASQMSMAGVLFQTLSRKNSELIV